MPPISSLTACAPAIILALLASGCDRQSPDAAQQTPGTSAPASAVAAPVRGLDRSHAGTALPDVMLEGRGTEDRAMSEWAGRPLLLNLWATWCAPCVVELPLLDALAAQQGNALAVVAASQDLRDTGNVEPFLAERDFAALDVWLDPENALADAYGGQVALPMTVLYDAEGREVWRYYGERDWSDAESADLVAEGL